MSRYGHSDMRGRRRFCSLLPQRDGGRVAVILLKEKSFGNSRLGERLAGVCEVLKRDRQIKRLVEDSDSGSEGHCSASPNAS